MGQVVLTVRSAPTVRSVILMTDGQPVQVPLPQGALTGGPVTTPTCCLIMHHGDRALIRSRLWKASEWMNVRPVEEPRARRPIIQTGRLVPVAARLRG